MPWTQGEESQPVSSSSQWRPTKPVWQLQWARPSWAIRHEPPLWHTSESHALNCSSQNLPSKPTNQNISSAYYEGNSFTLLKLQHVHLQNLNFELKILPFWPIFILKSKFGQILSLETQIFDLTLQLFTLKPKILT